MSTGFVNKKNRIISPKIRWVHFSKKKGKGIFFGEAFFTVEALQ